MNTQEQNLTNDEKTLSMFSHFSLLIGGIILPLIIWAIKKDDSKFVRFHSLQSIFYHIAFVIAVIAYSMFFLFMILATGVGMDVFKKSGHHSDPPILFIMVIIVLGLGFLLLALGGAGYSIYVGLKAGKGELCKIPIIGKKVYDHVYKK